MNLSDYERIGYSLYGQFAQAIASILKAALASKPEMAVQEIQFRAKNPQSLSRKLLDRGKSECVDIAREIKDLAGCRLIFYTNSDAEGFGQSHLIHDLFDVDFDRTKIHYPTGDTSDANDLFMSENYVVRLKANRADLPEYAGFADLHCEVQVQTILNHAWAQMAHDTIYKKPIEKGFGSSVIQGINDRLSKVMRDYLLPAGYAFDKINADYRRLLAGKALFDADALKSISDCSNLNDLHEAIERFGSHVLPLYDDIEAKYAEIAATLVHAATRAVRMTPIPNISVWGEFPGESREKVLGEIFDIFRRHRYVDFDLSIDILLQLAPLMDGEEQTKLLLNFATALSEYNIGAWRQVGASLQDHLVSRVAALDDASALSALRPLIEMLGQTLGSTITGTTLKANAIIRHQGTVSASEDLATMRSESISQLQRLHRLAESADDRALIRHAMHVAGNTPMNAGYDQAFGKIILNDLSAVIAFFQTIVPDLSLEERRKLERELFRHYYAFSSLPGDLEADDALDRAHHAFLDEMDAMRLLLNSDEDFRYYKLLVGFDSISDHMWEARTYDHKHRSEEAERQVEALAGAVDENSIGLWIDRLNIYAMTESDDAATFIEMTRFLRRLASDRPDLIDLIIAGMNERLRLFSSAMFHGLTTAGHGDKAHAHIDRWIEEGFNLSNAAWFLQTDQNFDEDQLVRLLDKAINQQDQDTIANCCLAAVRQFERHKGSLIERVFLPCVSFLSGKGDPSWMGWGFFTLESQAILKALDETQARIVLDALLQAETLDRREEGVLAGVAGRHGVVVLEFFERRLEIEMGETAPHNYRAIPYRLHSLREQLALDPHRLIETVRTWFDRDDDLFEYRGGSLVEAVFPRFPAAVETCLREKIDAGEAKSADFVLAILTNYRGIPAVYSLCRDIVAKLESEDPLLHLVEKILYASGVVSGSHGHARDLAEKRDLISPWLEDPRPKVQAFAANFLHLIDQRLIHEQRRADHDVAMRNLSFDADE